MNPDPKLEKLLDAELKKLPPLSAPPSLMRHVLARLEARATLPWWQRAWWDWPRAAQAAFIGVALGVATLFTTGGAWANDQAADWFQQLGDRAGSFAASWNTFAPLTDAGVLLWQKTAQPLLLYGLIAAGVFYLVCVGLGTMVFRVAWKQNSN